MVDIIVFYIRDLIAQVDSIDCSRLNNTFFCTYYHISSLVHRVRSRNQEVNNPPHLHKRHLSIAPHTYELHALNHISLYSHVCCCCWWLDWELTSSNTTLGSYCVSGIAIWSQSDDVLRDTSLCDTNKAMCNNTWMIIWRFAFVCHRTFSQTYIGSTYTW